MVSHQELSQLCARCYQEATFEEANIEVKVFSSTPQDKEFSEDIDKLNLLRETNPEMFRKLTNEKDIELEEEEEKIPSFMKMEN